MGSRGTWVGLDGPEEMVHMALTVKEGQMGFIRKAATCCRPTMAKQ